MTKKTLTFERYFTKADVSPYDTIKWKTVDAVIKAPNGDIKYQQLGINVPEYWSTQAIQVVSEKYFRVVGGKKETSVRAMIERVVCNIAGNGVVQGLLKAGSDESLAFADELRHILLYQMFAFNSPVWFNVGVLENPQSSACFIQHVEDTMESITQTLKQEMMLFKGGSGTGSNLSTLRSSWESLSGGGLASGPVSFMEVFDAGAGVTKSGGTTRRAAKMVVLNINHPDILEQRSGRPGFIRVKRAAEQLAHDLYSTGKYSAEFNAPNNVYEKVGFQNANNSVRVTDEFMESVEKDGETQTVAVTTGQYANIYKSRMLWQEIAEAAHFCGDPGIQFDTTTNKMHTCKVSGRINASNPCSEYLFLDDTACNLGSHNLMRYYDVETGLFDIQGFIHANQVCITAMEILVGMSSYPSPSIAENSRKFRPLGIGYANLGGLLMSMGLAYDSDAGRSVAAAITAIMSGESYAQSARMAEVLGPFECYPENRESFEEVIQTHFMSTSSLLVAKNITAVDGDFCHSYYDLMTAGHNAWKMADSLKSHGYRNAQISVIAPTGTISFLMDCDTTGCEPCISTVSYKKLVGGGALKMVNKLTEVALKKLGYTQEQIDLVNRNVELHGQLDAPDGPPVISPTDRPVFQTALGTGDYAVSVAGHLKMMAAIQPYLSGGISKTVNMAADTTVQQVADTYMMAWKLGLKCVAIFRDGCKLSQPVSTKQTDTSKKEPEAKVEKIEKGAMEGIPSVLLWGQRKHLPDERQSTTKKMTVGGHTSYVTVSKYPDGSPGEMFMEFGQTGSTLNGMIDLAMTFGSIALQYGAPLSALIKNLKHTKFDPSGFTNDKDIRIVSSIPDFLGRWLESKFYGPPDEGKAGEPTETVVPLTPAPKPVFPDLGEVVTGNPCGKCGNMTQRAGSCWVCKECGETTGCG